MAGWANSVKMHSEHPNSRKTYLIDGVRAPRAGEVFRNPDLAASLRLIAANGRDGFYRGKTADAILAMSREQGGILSPALHALKVGDPLLVGPRTNGFFSMPEVPAA